MRNQSNMGFNHGPGKGDKSRVTNEAEYKKNMEEIEFPGVSGVRKTARGWVKTYGKPATKPDNENAK
jgi:hypothetical protein